MYHPTYQVDLELLNKHSKKTALDIIDYGCGNGILLELLPTRKVKSYVGYEVSSAAIAVGKQKYGSKKVRFVEIKKNHPPQLGKSNSVDVIILVGVLQYLTPGEIKHVIKESYRVLRKGGIFLASCVTDHAIYRYLNMYQFFFPNRYINHSQIVGQLQKVGFKVIHDQEKGLIIGPLFSHGLVIFFDAIDKVIFRNKGQLGPIGIKVRQLFQPLMRWEYQWPGNYGYTLFLVGKK